MKKILLILSVIALSFSVKAQMPGFAIKVMGGINMPSFEMAYATSSAQKINYAFSLDAALGKKHYIQGGISLRKYSGDFTVKGKASDLVIPAYGIHAFYGRQLLDLKVTKLRLFAGPDLEFLDTPVSKDFTINESDYNSKVFNLVVGSELKILAVLFSLQYEIGLTDMMSNASMKNNIFIAKIGISIL